MTAWERLLAASSLAVGTAWQLISSPRTGGGTIVNDGVAVQLTDKTVALSVADTAVDVVLADLAVVAEVVPRLAATLQDQATTATPVPGPTTRSLT